MSLKFVSGLICLKLCDDKCKRNKRTWERKFNEKDTMF